MKKNDVALFGQAFDELEREGYFKGFNRKVKHLRPSGDVYPTTFYGNAISKRNFSSKKTVANGHVSNPMAGPHNRKSKAGSRLSKLKSDSQAKKSKAGSRASRLKARIKNQGR